MVEVMMSVISAMTKITYLNFDVTNQTKWNNSVNITIYFSYAQGLSQEVKIKKMDNGCQAEYITHVFKSIQ